MTSPAQICSYIVLLGRWLCVSATQSTCGVIVCLHHGTAVDAVLPATPQTPTAPALEPLPPMGITALCFDNSTRSAINDIACRAAEQTAAPSAGLWPRRSREDTWRHAQAYRERLLQLPDKNTDFRLLVQNWYKGAPTVVTPASACLSGLTTTQQLVSFGTCSPERQRLCRSRIPWRAAASPSSWPAAC